MDQKRSLYLSTHPKTVKIQNTVQPHREKEWPFLFKLPNDTEILILGMHPSEMKAWVHIRLMLTMS